MDIDKKIKNTEWQKWGGRRMTMRLCENWVLCPINFKKIFGLKFPDQIFLIKDAYGYGYLNYYQYKRFLKKSVEKIKTRTFLKLYESKATPFFIDFLGFCRLLAKKNLKKLANKELLEVYDKFIKKEDIFTNYLWFIFIIDDYYPEVLRRKLNKIYKRKSEMNKALKAVMSPKKKTAIFSYNLDILNLAKRFKDKKINNIELDKKLNRLEKKYAFFPILNMDEKPFDKNHFKKEIIKAAKNRELDQEIEGIEEQFLSNKRRYSIILKKLKNNKEIFALTEAGSRIAFWREYRNDVRRECYFQASFLYREIARRLKIPLNRLLYLTREEVRKSLKKEKCILNPVSIKKRIKYFSLSLINLKPHYIFSHKKVENLLNKIEISKSVKYLKGLSVCKGKIKSKVGVILNIQKEARKFKKGDILVTSMTNLDFLPIMKKAAAIITDEGGMTCHAAIVSREFGIPCIVGTKIATQVLKDGDRVEVDADKGVVRILK